jgi:DNA-binding winged helix-turn-helix (wHTH) protein/Tfp pilus assembly protein PilF
MNIYKFRNILLNTAERRITKKGDHIDLSPKAFDILQTLIVSAGEIVTRDEIFGKVWNGSLVEDGNLSVHISKLRKVLGETKTERFIETVAGIGYRFLPAVETVENDQSEFDIKDGLPNRGNGLHRSDSEAIRLLLKGRYFLEKRTPVDVQKGIKFLERSIAYDPLNVYAYADLVDGYRLLNGFDHISSIDAMRKIEPLLSLMSELKPDLDVVHLRFGEAKMYLEWKLDEAAKHFQLAIAANQNCLSAHYRSTELLVFSGRFSEALAKLPTITYLDPFSLPTYVRISRLFYLMENFDSALLYLTDALDLEPSNLETLIIYGAVLAELGDYSGAMNALIRSQRDHPNAESLAMIGYVHALTNEKRKANKITKQLLEFESNRGSLKTHLARIYLTIGEKDTGYSLLEEAVEHRCSDLIAISIDPRWKAVRGESRFEEIVRRIWPPEHSKSKFA